MNYRTVAGLAAALVVVGALALFSQYDPRPPAPGGGLWLPGLGEELEQVTRMTVTGAGNEPVATLERGEDGGWTIAEKAGYPADVEKVHHTLISLAEARVVEAKTANPDFHDRLGVEGIEDDGAGGVAIALTGTDSPVNVIVGDTEGASQGPYVREADQTRSFLIDRNPEVGSDTTDWLATEILAIPGARVARVTVAHPDGEVVNVFKDDPEQSNFDVDAIPEDRELQYASIANVMGTVLSNLRLQDVEPLADTEVPVTVTEFLTFDGLAVTAESFERGDEAWVAFRAESRALPEDMAEDLPEDVPEDLPEDAEAAAVPEETPAEDASIEPGASTDEPDASAESTDAENEGVDAGDESVAADDEDGDIEAEARDLDQRLSGWRYRIANYQFDQMTRRMSDLLRDPPEEEE